mmetsp:Transcript_5322/g.16274  ORF Transcript_5322/g.16274 Transcript_5322/m.16274 type:complete len:92 (+) Transcript_5322:847-1122(+)
MRMAARLEVVGLVLGCARIAHCCMLCLCDPNDSAIFGASASASELELFCFFQLTLRLSHSRAEEPYQSSWPSGGLALALIRARFEAFPRFT